MLSIIVLMVVSFLLLFISAFIEDQEDNKLLHYGGNQNLGQRMVIELLCLYRIKARQVSKRNIKVKQENVKRQ